LESIQSKYKTIQNYLKNFSFSEFDEYGIHSIVLDNYIKSCAGYSVITYLLGKIKKKFLKIKKKRYIFIF
jgi:phosphatidylinositol 3-kinase